VVCPAPLEILMIDFEAAVRKDELGDEAFAKRCKQDFLPMLREAIFLQCTLGKQPGPLADMAWDRIDKLFKRPERFLQEIGEQGLLA